MGGAQSMVPQRRLLHEQPWVLQHAMIGVTGTTGDGDAGQLGLLQQVVQLRLFVIIHLCCNNLFTAHQRLSFEMSLQWKMSEW